MSTGTLSLIQEEYHGRGGPLPVSPHPRKEGLTQAFFDAAHDLGCPTVDPNGPDQLGKFLGISWGDLKMVGVIAVGYFL